MILLYARKNSGLIKKKRCTYSLKKVSEKYVDRYYQDNVWNSNLFDDCLVLLALVN